ncbi:MAG: sulfurtransferase, partial [Gammaproteobacteria bacterium]
MSHDTLIDAETLAAHLDDPNWVVLDCRFDLGNPSAGREAWLQAHLPGAVYADLDRDMSRPPGPEDGRHPLPDR